MILQFTTSNNKAIHNPDSSAFSIFLKSILANASMVKAGFQKRHTKPITLKYASDRAILVDKPIESLAGY